ncbi:MAG: hypothetical protein ACI8Y4_004867 [Candidatus Poriferisodalaceae bacterium]|jgi:hypothetical protein
MATQLRRYEIAEGRMDDFLAFFPNMIPVRSQFGFSVDVGLVDRENNQFVWTTSHEGSVEEFVAAEKVYSVSPERLAVVSGAAGIVENMHVAMVDKAF